MEGAAGCLDGFSLFWWEWSWRSASTAGPGPRAEVPPPALGGRSELWPEFIYLRIVKGSPPTPAYGDISVGRADRETGGLRSVAHQDE